RRGDGLLLARDGLRGRPARLRFRHAARVRLAPRLRHLGDHGVAVRRGAADPHDPARQRLRHGGRRTASRGRHLSPYPERRALRGASQSVRPRVYAWRVAFGFPGTMVWLYVEVLRILMILRGSD